MTVKKRFGKCKYCPDNAEFELDRYNHHRQNCCGSADCKAKANRERQRRCRARRKANKEEDEAFRMKEAERQRQRRLKAKDFSSENNALRELSLNRGVVSSVLFGVLSYTMDCSDASELTELIGHMSQCGRRLINQKTPCF